MKNMLKNNTKTRLTFMGILTTLSALSSAALGFEPTAVYHAKQGPAEVTVTLNEGLMGEIKILYNGHLLRCEGQYGRKALKKVQAVVVTRSNYSKKESYFLNMKDFCTQPYSASKYPKDAAELIIGSLGSRTALYWEQTDLIIWRQSVGDLNHYYYGKELPEALRGFELAFNSAGNWDSNSGQNYKFEYFTRIK